MYIRMLLAHSRAQVSHVQEESRQGSHRHCSDWQVVQTPAHHRPSVESGKGGWMMS